MDHDERIEKLLEHIRKLDWVEYADEVISYVREEGGLTYVELDVWLKPESEK